MFSRTGKTSISWGEKFQNHTEWFHWSTTVVANPISPPFVKKVLITLYNPGDFRFNWGGVYCDLRSLLAYEGLLAWSLRRWRLLRALASWIALLERDKWFLRRFWSRRFCCCWNKRRNNTTLEVSKFSSKNNMK